MVARSLGTVQLLMRRPVAHPALYMSFVLLSVMDLVLTTIILARGGTELNAFARHAIELAGVWGLMLLKFASVLTVLAVCEALASRHIAAAHEGSERTSRRVAEWAVAITSIPVTVALVQLGAAATLSLQ